MRKLHLSILQELACLETQKERGEAITEILDLLDNIVDGKLLPEEGDNPGQLRINPFEGQILWSSEPVA